MPELARSRLLLQALAQRDADPDAGARERLRSSYLAFKERAEQLAAEIARSFEDLTVHDESHLDALWEMSDLATEDEQHLSPLEAFVLGGAILIHDLGLAVASYPAGARSLQDTERWNGHSCHGA